jgi:hypothetical protein
MTSYELISNDNCREIFLPGKGFLKLEGNRVIVDLSKAEFDSFTALGKKHNFEILTIPNGSKVAAKPEVKEDAKPEDAAKPVVK